MREFDTLYLSWRSGQSSRRYIVGVIKENSEGNYSFIYVKEQVQKASEVGFTAYTEFPDIEKEYRNNVIDIFAQRLMKSGRPDIQSFYDFWEVDKDKINDKFYLLGHTQGLLPTDNFEFLADYNVVPHLHFLTDIAGLSHLQIPSDKVQIGDELQFCAEPQNEYDKDAVYVLKDSKQIGYIKKIHCKVFHKFGADNLKLKVKAIEKNGVVKKVFVKVYQT